MGLLVASGKDFLSGPAEYCSKLQSTAAVICRSARLQLAAELQSAVATSCREPAVRRGEVPIQGHHHPWDCHRPGVGG